MAEDAVNRNTELLLIGGSAGSLEVLLELLPAFDRTRSFAIIIIVHRKSGESQLATLLSSRSNWTVKEAEEKESIENGTIYIAPSDYHLLVEKDKTLSLDFSEKVHFSRPAIDVTFETAAEVYGNAALALLLSGANADGSAGLIRVKEMGGTVVIQDPGDAEVSFMPEQALKVVDPDYAGNTEGIARWILARVGS